VGDAVNHGEAEVNDHERRERGFEWIGAHTPMTRKASRV